MSVRIINDDCLTALPQLAAEGVLAHCCVTDPPYHLTSGNQAMDWSSMGPGNKRPNVGQTNGSGRKAGFMGHTWDGGDVAFRPETWAAVADCLRPGAFLVAFASTRGYHRMVCAIEDAGLVIHPMLAWITGQGFPKAKRFNQPELDGWRYGLQALKPAVEPICLAQKPLAGTGSQNWAKHGCGGLNIGACRVPLSETDPLQDSVQHSGNAMDPTGAWGFKAVDRAAGLGRWPANVIHDGSPDVEEAFAAFGESTSTDRPRHNTTALGRMNDDAWQPRATTTGGFADAGSPSRFFFSAKADASDRAGSRHPTVKPTALMRWLVQLVCPPGGLVLDPFAGTGSTGLAADQLGFDAILIERDPTYAADARRKITADCPLFAEAAD